jgi:hypothetical protein
MPLALHEVPAGETVFLDANIFIYGFFAHATCRGDDGFARDADFDQIQTVRRSSP